MREWLTKNNIAALPRLAETLTVEPGWEQAVETVLADYLEAVCVPDSWDEVVAAINDLTDGRVTIIAAGRQEHVDSVITASLASKVKTNLPVNELLSNVLTADNLQAALNMRSQLNQQQSIVTKDGIWLGKSWLRVTRERDGHRGVIQREQEIQTLKQHLEQQAAIASELETAIHDANTNLYSLETALTNKQQIAQQDAAVLRDISSKSSAAQQKLENMLSRKQRISIEIADHQQQLMTNSADSSAVRTELEVAIEAMASLAVRKEQLSEAREKLQARERTTKQQAKECQEQMHELELAKQNLTTKLQGLQHTISRVDQQLANLHTRYQQLQQTLIDEEAPNQQVQVELEILLAERVVVEESLQEARLELEAYEQQMKMCEKQRIELERAAQQIKDILDQSRLERQSLEVRRETINEQLVINNIDVQTVIVALPEDAEESAWAERIDGGVRRGNPAAAISRSAIFRSKRCVNDFR